MAILYPIAAVARLAAQSLAASQPSAAGEVDWNTAPLPSLLDHLITRRHDYLRHEMPLLTELVARVHRVYSVRHPGELDGLPQVFESLRAELQSHLETEELLLFPAIRLQVRDRETGAVAEPIGVGGLAQTIARMEYEHEGAEAAMRRIRELTNGYAVPHYACATYRALILGLQALEADIRHHIHLENDILHPRVLAL